MAQLQAQNSKSELHERVATVIGGHPLAGGSSVARRRGLASCTGRVAETVYLFKFALATLAGGGGSLKSNSEGVIR